MELSENDAFRREIRKLLENESIYLIGFDDKIFKLIDKYEDKSNSTSEKTRPMFPDREAADEFVYG